MKSQKEIHASIDNILIPYCDCIAWKDFSDAGNPCYDPYEFNSPAEEAEAAFTYGAVLLKMPKGSDLHKELSKKVAEALGAKYVTYDWLAKAIARVLSGTTFDELLSMAKYSRKIKDEMKARGVTQIDKSFLDSLDYDKDSEKKRKSGKHISLIVIRN